MDHLDHFGSLWITLDHFGSFWIMWRKQRLKNLEFIKELFGGTTNIVGTIFKIDVDDGIKNYTDTVGDPMAEDTLIVGDEDNNVILCFDKCNDLYHKNTVLKGVHVGTHFNYREECTVHKMHKLADVPERIVNIMFQSNTVHNVTKNFNELHISRPIHMHNSSKAYDFMYTHYMRGGMIPLKLVKNNPEWIKEYEDDIVTKRVHMCKSCKSKAQKGCCSNYSTVNRSMITMVIGWSEQ